MADDRIEIAIELDDGSVRRGFARIQQDGVDTGQAINRSFGPLAATLAVVAGVAGTAAAAFSLIKSAIQEAAEGDESLNRLNTSLRLAGTFSETASQQFQDLAEQLQNTTVFSDDQILSVAALARTYSKSNDAAIALTKTSLDLATAIGTDADSAVKQLAATLNGDVSRALSRLAPELKTFTKEQLEGGAAIDAINARLSGSAVAAVNTYSGRVTQLNNQYNNLLETIGQAFTQSPAVVAAIRTVGDALSSINQSLSNSLGGQDIFKSIIINFSIITQAGIESAERIGLSFQLAFARVQQAIAAGNVLLSAGISDKYNQQLQDASKRVDELKSKFTDTSAVVGFFTKLIDNVVAANDVIADGARNTTGAVTLGLQSVKGAYDEVKKYLDDAASKTVDGLDAIFAAREVALENAFSKGIISYEQFLEDKKSLDAAYINESEKLVGKQQNLTAGFTNFLNQSFKAGISAIGASLVRGKSSFTDFKNFVFNLLGDLLIETGFTLSLFGKLSTKLSTLMTNIFTAGPASIAFGVALIALGGALKALAGGGGGGGGGLGTDPSPGIGGITPSPSLGNENPDAAIDGRQQQRVVVNIQGDVLDSKESGLRIVDLLNEAFDSQGSRVLAT